MSESDFKVVFSGPAVEEGEIDVRDLAPALLALGDVFQAANTALNGSESTASVKVRATASGSFEVNLTLVQEVASALGVMLDWAKDHDDGIAAANELADLVLKGTAAAGSTAGGLFWLIKWLRGRRPKEITRDDGGVTIQVGDTNVTVDNRVIVLAADIKVRQGAKKFADVLKKEGIDTITFRRDGEAEVFLTSRDADAFIVPDAIEEELADAVRRMNVQIVSLSFKDDNKWRVTDGGDPFSVSIEDQDFLKRIANNDIAFSKGDYLICDVRERQVSTANGLKLDRSIVRVVEHRAAPRQLRLV
ncbi:MAG: hypothetical protein ACOZAM_15770 [Pseudomonadota bacterium]